MDLLENYRVKPPHFQREWYFHILNCEDDISSPSEKNDDLLPQSTIFPLGTRNIINSQLRMWKCPIMGFISTKFFVLIKKM